jgi:hypothetical protein
VRRHESLRTTFASLRGRPVQVVAPPRPWTLPRVDLSALAHSEEELERLAEEEARRPFDLACGPLFRAALVRLSAERHALFVSMHHIVSDGWSLGVLVREIGELYRAAVAGRPDPLPPLPVQYADFARWQREWLEGEAVEPHVAYWRGQLGDGPPALQLTTDRPRLPVQTFRGAHHHWNLEPELREELVRLGAQAGVTRFMTLLSVFSTLLHRMSGQDDFCVGTYIANRNRAETEGLIGFFVNNLALRVEPAPELGFRQLLGRVRETTLAAYAHQDLPFEKLLAELKLERTPGRTPLFQVLCVLQNMPKPEPELPGLAVSILPVESGRANFDLTLWIEERSAVEAALEYNADLFDPATAARFAVHFETLSAPPSGPNSPMGATTLAATCPVRTSPWPVCSQRRRNARPARSPWSAATPR